MGRFTEAAKAFLDVFQGQNPENRGMLARILPSYSNQPKTPKSTEEMLKFFRVSPLLRMVAGRISSDIAAQNWRVYAPITNKRADVRYARAVKSMPRRARYNEVQSATKQGDLQEIENHPATMLMRKSNDLMLGGVMRKVTQLHLDLVGEAFWLLARNLANAPIQAFVVPPSWVEHTPESDEPYFKVRIGDNTVEVPPSEMIWFLDPDPAAPYSRGMGVGRTLADELEIEEYVSKHVRGFFQNRARPDILVTGPNLPADSAKRLEQKWLEKLQGFKRAYLPFFMEAPDGMQLHQLSQDFESMQLLDLRKHERDIVMQTFGVSPETFGVIENSNRATISVADFTIAKHVLTPRLEVLREVLQERLMPLYGDESLIIDFDSPIDKDKEFDLKAAKIAPWSRTVNEWREMQSLDDVDDGDMYVVPNNVVSVESVADIEGDGEITNISVDNEG